MALDLNWLDINQHVYTWNAIEDEQYRTEIGLLALQLMDKHQSINPQVENILAYLDSKGIEHGYNHDWFRNIQNKTVEVIKNLENSLDSVQDLNKSISTAVRDNQDLWNQIEQGVKISIILGSYNQGLGFLTTYGQFIQFQTQLNNREQLDENKYIQFLFYQYMVNTYNLIYFPEEHVISGSYKSLELILKKLNYYYNKNEMIMIQNPDSHEVKYYWLIKFYNLTILFKQFKIDEFLVEFNQILKIPEFIWLIQSNSNILSLFQIFFTLMKPFNQLGLLDSDDDFLIDEINYHQFPKFIYNNILSPLLNSNFTQVQTTFSDTRFINFFNAKLGYYLPASINKSSFLDYFHLVIDFKIFLLILSNTKVIPRPKMLSILGYQNLSKQSTLSNDLLVLLSTLNLGNSNIGYDFQNDCFYNHDKDHQRDSLQLKNSIDNLTVELQGESIAQLLKGALIEKFMSS